MRKRIYILITFLIMIIPFYVSAEEAGNLKISCGSSTIKAGETINCTITGKANKEITNLHANINLSENLKMVSFDLNSIWFKMDNTTENVDGNIDVVTDSGDPISSDFTIGTLKVKAKDGVTAKNETISLTSIMFSYDWTDYQIPDATTSIRIPSNNNSLSSIKVNDDGKFFDENKTSFDLTNESETVNIVVTTKDGKAKVKGDGQQKLNYGKNTLKIEVTAEDGSKKVYTLNINRPDSRSKENYLLDFGFLNHDIKFDKNKTEYELIVENNISKIGGFSSDTESSVPKTDMFSNVLFIDGTKVSVSKKVTDVKYVLNDIDLYKKIQELDDYLYNSDASSLEEKCNDDKTECLAYKDGELFGKYIDKGGTYYKNGIPISYFYEDGDGNTLYNLYVFDDLKVGTNSLKVKITAENGDERVYTFNIIRKDADGKVADNDIMPPQTGNTIYVIAVIMLVLSFGVGIYFYTKKIKNKI